MHWTEYVLHTPHLQEWQSSEHFKASFDLEEEPH